jgi:hypothetical protein
MENEFLHLAATLADQPDHHHVGLGLSCDHPQQHALAHPRAGKQADALPLAEGQQTVDGSHTDIQRGLHRTALERIDRRQLYRQRVAPGEFAALVQRLAKAVDHATKPGFVDLQQRLVLGREYARAGGQADRLLERHQIGDIAVEADHLGIQQTAVSLFDAAALAGAALAAEALQEHAGNPHQASGHLGQLHAVERAQRFVEFVVEHRRPLPFRLRSGAGVRPGCRGRRRDAAGIRHRPRPAV